MQNRKKESMLAKNANNWGGLNAEDNGFHDAMWAQHVPACGKAKTLGGEILRAIDRIIYKFYNDGDTVARYYNSSYNHSWGAEKFLYTHVPGYVLMRDITDDMDFESAACKNLKRVVDYLRSNPALFEVENQQDFLELSPKEERPYDEEWDEDEEEDEEE